MSQHDRRKLDPTPRRADAIARQREHGTSIRDWFTEQAAKRRKALDKIKALLAKKKPTAGGPSRGVDRVPAHLRVNRSAPVVLVEHTGLSHEDRRHRSYVRPVMKADARPLLTVAPLGSPLTRAGQRAGLMRITAPAGNEPYRNPARAARLARSGRLRKDLEL